MTDGRASDAERGPRSIVWLASYPKSGNTWVRAMLNLYWGGGDGELNLNALEGGSPLNDRLGFDDAMGLSSGELTQDELEALYPEFALKFADHVQAPYFVKTHAAYRMARGGPIHPAEASLGAVYLVRNPLDVAVSYAHHQGRDADWAVGRLCDRDAVQDHWPDRISYALPQRLSSWSAHAESWLTQTAIPTLTVRYEDCLGAPEDWLGRIVRFAGMDYDAALIDRAVEHTRFERLQKLEKATGFAERSAAAPSFFRQGRAGGWREALSPDHVRRIVGAHGAWMETLGYMDEAAEYIETARGQG